MSDASKVKRFIYWFGPDYDGSAQFSQEVVLASDFDRIVAELKTDVARLCETVRYLESTNPKLTDAEEAIAKLRAGVERQARVIEGVKSALNNHATRPSDALIQIRETVEQGEGT